VTFRLAQLPLYGKLTLTFFLAMLGTGYLSAVWLIILAIGHGEPPTERDVQDHYGGEKRPPSADPNAPSVPRRPLSSLERQIRPPEGGNREGGMYQYLARSKDEETRDAEDPKRVEDAARALKYQKVIHDWVGILRDQEDGKRKGDASPDAPEPFDRPNRIDFDKAAADAKKLNFDQYYEVYVKSILDRHCERCHGGGNPKGRDSIRLSTLADVRKHLAVGKPDPGKTIDAGAGDHHIDGGMDEKKLALHIHIHAVTMGFMALSVAVLMFFTGYSNTVKLLVVPWPMLGAIFDVAGWVIMKYVSVHHPAVPGAQITMMGGGLMGAGMGLQILLVFASIWFGKTGEDKKD